MTYLEELQEIITRRPDLIAEATRLVSAALSSSADPAKDA